MSRMKKSVAIIAALVIVLAAGSAFASVIKTPADIVSDLTSKSSVEINQERSEGKTYGTIANEAGKLDEFREQMLIQKKAILDQAVKDGKLTQEQANEIFDKIKNRQASCDGTGNGAMGRNAGLGLGKYNGQGKGLGAGRGMGMRNGSGACGGCGLNG